MIVAALLENSVHRLECLEEAARCRRRAYSVPDRETSKQLLDLASDYERNAWGARHR